MLDEKEISYRYRDYREAPLTVAEIRHVLDLLGLGPGDVLRRNDKAYRQLELDGSESDDTLIALMAEHPTLLQRPLGVLGERAALGRPPERLLELVVEG